MSTEYNIGKRLKFLMRLKELTISGLAAKANISEDTIKSIRSGRTLNPSLNILTAIADALDCTLDNLIDRVPIDDSETNLFRKWRSLDSHGRNLVMMLIDNELSNQPSFTSNTRLVKCYVPSAYIGNGALFDGERVEYISIPANYMKNATIGIKIISDTNIPLYFPGDILALEERLPQNEETAVYFKENIIYIRKHLILQGKSRLVPPVALNNEVELRNIDDYTCLGTIIGLFRHAV